MVAPAFDGDDLRTLPTESANGIALWRWIESRGVKGLSLPDDHANIRH